LNQRGFEEEKELRARIHEEGTRVWGLLRVGRNGGRAVVLDGEIGEVDGDGDGGWRLVERDIIRCRHGGLEGRDEQAKQVAAL
jgi:hypothetical protein